MIDHLKRSDDSLGFTYLGMLRVRRMARVLRRLRQLRHVDVVGPLRVARIDVVAGHAARLLVLRLIGGKAGGV